MVEPVVVHHRRYQVVGGITQRINNVVSVAFPSVGPTLGPFFIPDENWTDELIPTLIEMRGERLVYEIPLGRPFHNYGESGHDLLGLRSGAEYILRP